MKKLLEGIIEFRKNTRPAYRERFAHLALGQSPDCLFFACSDSRVVPNVFASTQPGDLFVVRNVGNLVPPWERGEGAGGSEAAAVEFAVDVLGVRDIVVCGHSECGAMRALMSGGAGPDHPGLDRWLALGKSSLAHLDDAPLARRASEAHNHLSQVNVLQQLAHLRSFPAVQRGLEAGRLALHGWWFDLAHAEVSAYDAEERRFVPIGDDDEG